ncbi:hypothetical protein C8R48DRAFT_670830 [Suillus tomentosus]|nr:hypothetical protein C8R48DRAFT_670830 [Suillus tomentosus]
MATLSQTLQLSQWLRSQRSGEAGSHRPFVLASNVVTSDRFSASPAYGTFNLPTILFMRSTDMFSSKWMIGFDGAKDIMLGFMFSAETGDNVGLPIFVQKALVFIEWKHWHRFVNAGELSHPTKISQKEIVLQVVASLTPTLVWAEEFRANICMVNKLSQGPVSVVGGCETITTGDIPIQRHSILTMPGVRCRFNSIVLDNFAIPEKLVMHTGVLGEGHLEAGDEAPDAPNMLWQVEDGKFDVKTLF